MQDKTTSLADAVKLVNSGDTLALGGMNLYRRPVAFVRELLKTNVRDLTLLCFTASYESDLLIGAGRVAAIRTCYCGLEAFGLAPMFTALATRGDLKVIEESESSLVFGLRASLAGVGFMYPEGYVQQRLGIEGQRGGTAGCRQRQQLDQTPDHAEAAMPALASLSTAWALRR